MKTTTIYWILGIIVVTGIIIYIINKNNNSTNNNIINDLFDRNGNPINANAKTKPCDPECIEPYPQGSQYYGYYYCRKNCAVFNRNVNPIYSPIFIQRPHIINNPPRPTPMN